MKRLLKKGIALSLGIVLSIIPMTGCSHSEKNSNKTVRIAIQTSIGATTILVAKENGFLEEELKDTGVDVQWSIFAAGPPMNEAFAAGKQDIGYIGDVPLILAKASGQNTVTIANAGYSPQTVALVVNTASDISQVSQLKGKKVGFVKGSIGHHLLGVLLEDASLKLSDIEEVNLAVTDIGTAIEKKEIDAGIIWDPSLTKAEDAGQVKVIADGSTNEVKRNSCYYFADKDFAQNNSEVIKAFIRALKRSEEYIKDSPEEAASSISEITGLDKETLIKVHKSFVFSPNIDETDIKELKEVEEFLRKENLSSRQVDINQFVDVSYLKEADEG